MTLELTDVISIDLYRPITGAFSVQQGRLAYAIGTHLLGGESLVGPGYSVGTYQTATPDDLGRFALISNSLNLGYTLERFHDPFVAALEFVRVTGSYASLQLLEAMHADTED